MVPDLVCWRKSEKQYRGEHSARVCVLFLIGSWELCGYVPCLLSKPSILEGKSWRKQLTWAFWEFAGPSLSYFHKRKECMFWPKVASFLLVLWFTSNQGTFYLWKAYFIPKYCRQGSMSWFAMLTISNIWGKGLNLFFTFCSQWAQNFDVPFLWK